MAFEPSFRRDRNGNLLLTDTLDAKLVKRERRDLQWKECSPGGVVNTEAKASLSAAGGDPTLIQHVLGQYKLQFGCFRGMTFKWLLENSPGWVGWFIASFDAETETLKTGHDWIHKMALRRYLLMFEEGKEILKRKKEERERKKNPQCPASKILGDEELVSLVESIEASMCAKKSGDSNVVQHLTSHSQRDVAALMTQSVVETIPSSSGDSICAPIQPTSSIQKVAPLMPQLPLEQEATSSGDSICAPIQPTSSIQKVAPLMPQLPLEQEATSSGDRPLLLAGWISTVPEVDHHWISTTFFVEGRKGPTFDFSRVKQLWYYPPQPSLSSGLMNKVDRFFGHRLFLWMPRHIFHVQFHCTHQGCDGHLTNAGVHQKTRLVLDVEDYYIIAAEYFACSKCHKKVISWSEGVLDQLDTTMRSLFPCIMTARYACDLKVVRLLRQRTLGNSSSAVCKQVEEEHGESYLQSVQRYLNHCQNFKKSSGRGFFTLPTFAEPPPQLSIPRHRWFMKVYQLDVIGRIDYIKSSITSVFGNVLKMDSTKKITNKLAGRGRKTAMWATNVGNEHGQVLISVLTEGEGMGLKRMIDGLVKRYHLADVPAPKVLYVDRDCCRGGYIGKYFDSWPFIHIRLDIWHFMRRFPIGCTTDKHQLYGTFMKKLSSCIFRYDEEDMDLLISAKRSEMVRTNVHQPSDIIVKNSITNDELKLHCKRITRGVKQTTELISQLISSLDGDKGCDTLGVPLFNSQKIAELWDQQSHHVACIQDPPGVSLYIKTGTMKKGGVVLPVYRCARGSTSLESFHLHMNRFIPGTLASDTNFQVFLLDGIFRWNEDRRQAAVDCVSERSSAKTYSGPLKHAVNKLSQEVLGTPLFEDFRPPNKYTGELIGIEYLYSQTGEGIGDYLEIARDLAEDTELDYVEDEGFGEEEVEDTTLPPVGLTLDFTHDSNILPIPTDQQYRDMLLTPTGVQTTQQPEHDQTAAESEEFSIDDDTVGPDNIPGYSRVLALADFLTTLRQTQVMSEKQICSLTFHWNGLHDYDKKRTVFPARYSSRPLQGRFKSPKKKVAPGVESIERAILGPNTSPAQWPNCNRYVEATVEKLLALFPGQQQREKKKVSRWTLVIGAYHKIRDVIIKSPKAMAQTNIQLPSLNKKTLQQWFNEKSKNEEQQILLQGLDLPKPVMSVKGSIPKALDKPVSLATGKMDPFQFHDPTSTVGKAILKKPVTLKQRVNTETNTVPFILPRLPLPSPLSQSELRFPIPVQLFIPTSTESRVGGASVPSTVVPYSTQLYRKRKAVQEAEGKFKRAYNKRQNVGPPKCKKCGEDKKEPDHRQYRGFRFCRKVDKVSFEEWREIQVKVLADRKKTK